MAEEEGGGVSKRMEAIRKKSEADHHWGYYSKLVKNYPNHKEEIGHTSHIAKEYPNLIRRSKNAF
tara:strand:- start:8 stop:202 length:195 start_codon:yes stop_codon:yes gene_type:complete